MVDKDERDTLAVSNISMSLQVRQDTNFCLEALEAKKNSWAIAANTAPNTGPIQYTLNMQEMNYAWLLMYQRYLALLNLQIIYTCTLGNIR